MDHNPISPPNARYKHKPMCSCGAEPSYSDQWDSYYCPFGLVWLEKECSCTDACPFMGRPPTPKGES